MSAHSHAYIYTVTLTHTRISSFISKYCHKKNCNAAVKSINHSDYIYIYIYIYIEKKEKKTKNPLMIEYQ